MRDQPLEPTKPEAEFLTFYGVAVRHVHAADEETVDRRLDIAGVHVVLVAGERAPGLDQVFAAREDRDAIPAFLALPDRFVACGAHCALRKRLRFQLLQADHIGRGLVEPAEKNWEPAVDAIDVEGRDPHGPWRQAVR